MIRKVLFFLVFFNSLHLFAQQLQHCGADEMRINTLIENKKIGSAVISRDEKLEAYTKQYVQQFYKGETGSASYIIPVVFHVIHQYGNENISDAQIIDGVRVLNNTFRKRAADTASIIEAFKPIHADCDIEFRLAKIDPNGNCTNGINRIASSMTTTGTHNVKSLIHWDPTKYLNIYVVQNAAGLAGHAVWPADADTIPAWDGIVVSSTYIGSIGTSNPTQSVVLAHECGHYLNLHHIWGGNNVPNFYYYPCADPNKDCNIDDLVADTPPTIGWQSCNLSGASCGNVVDNVQNAMDYSYCNIMFTYGQKARMQACLNDTIAHRNNLWQTSNLIATGVYSEPAPLCEADFNCNKRVVCANANNQVAFKNTSYSGSFTSLLWNFDGGIPSTSTDTTPVVSYSIYGKYAVSLNVINNSDTVFTEKQKYITVLKDSGDVFPFAESFENTIALDSNEWFTNSLDDVNNFTLTNICAYNGVRSIMLNNFNNTQDTKDELYSPVINLLGGNNIVVSFKYAFAKKEASNSDLLQLYVNKDCNSNWALRYSATGTALATTAPTVSNFIPTGINEWKSGSITLPALYLTQNFRFKFVFTSRGGNNFYLDDISVSQPVGIADNKEQEDAIRVFPNPAFDAITVILPSKSNSTIEIYSNLGIKVSTIQCAATSCKIDATDLSQGIYYIKIVHNNKIYFKQFTIQK